LHPVLLTLLGGKLFGVTSYNSGGSSSILFSIDTKIAELKRLYASTENVNEIVQYGKKSFVNYLLEDIKRLETIKTIGTSKRYRTTYYHIIAYLKKANKSDLLFSDITGAFIKDFETYLISVNIKSNTTKNYINCIKKLFSQSVKEGNFIPAFDPFINFKNSREPVVKKRLEGLDIERIIKQKFTKEPQLRNTKNYFLFQVFAQGLRVSDLITMRFNNIQNGRLKFIQYKTKKPHSILINDNILWILKDFIPEHFEFLLTGAGSDGVIKSVKYTVPAIINQKYPVTIEGKPTEMTYTQVRDLFTKVKKSMNPLNADEHRIKAIRDQLDKVKFTMNFHLTMLLTDYAKKYENDFIFPILHNEHFDDVKFDDSTRLSKYQYNQLQSKTTIYNKRLKDLQKACNLNTVLTSHISRHTYTNLMLEEKYDVYEISKSLGHQRLATTEHYLNNFSAERIDEPNIELNKYYTHLL